MLSHYIVLLQKESQTLTPKYTRAKRVILRNQGCETIVRYVTWTHWFDPFNRVWAYQITSVPSE